MDSDGNMAGAMRNVVVVGGSYVGVATSQGLANCLPATHRVLLVEPHSHFHHLFAFPRYAILPKHEHKAFIPYTSTFASAPNPSSHAVVRARVSSLLPDRVVLDREWQSLREIPFDYLVVATGTRLHPPAMMEHEDKPPSVGCLQGYQGRIKQARSVIIVGGGAVGVQMATDLKEIYPEKQVTLVHSRNQLMPLYHEKLDEIIKERCKELGVELKLGSRVNVPPGGFPLDNASGSPVTVSLQSGENLTADFVITATGQTPNTEFLSGLPASSTDSLINPANGFIRVKPTLQFQDPKYPHMFAVGDVADSGAHKAARPGSFQGQVLARNILAVVEGREPSEHITVDPPGIHLTLGLTKNLVFQNPDTRKGQTEPRIIHRDDGQADMNIAAVWARRGATVSSEQDYHL
ncbi:FAD/NAD(P)-binding domain-containing protein [Xylariaceae sp. FL0662B]|nr:FAD/NAD(P)-binding domain-containing protein [Xylariaceae sp. FL0662B]